MALIRNTFIILLLIISLGLFSQDATFSQFYYNPNYYNPAYAGISGDLNIRSTYKKLWPGIMGGVDNINFTFDIPESAVSGGLAFHLQSTNEGTGLIKNTTFGAAYSYILPVIRKKLFIQMGLEASMVHKTINQDNLVFSNQLDPIYGDIYQSGFTKSSYDWILYPDFASGILLRYNLPKNNFGKPAATITAGTAFHHITQPSESFASLDAQLPMRYVAHIDAIIPINYNFSDYFTMSPALIYEKQEPVQHITYGLNIIINPIIAGLWVRNSNFSNHDIRFSSVIFTGGVTIFDDREKKIQLTYSYDFNTSKIQAVTGLSHEISIRVAFKDKELFPNKRSSLRQKARANKTCYNRF